jgi:octaprenyl-diphosphate synthase
MKRRDASRLEVSEAVSLEDLIARGVLSVVDDDYRRVEQQLMSSIRSEFSLAPAVARHLIEAGGKRIRPIVLCLAAGMCGYRGRDHILLAAVSEMIHSATLFHDDVIDEGEVRRGKPAANVIWGNQTVVLVGDFVFARAFTMMIDHGFFEISRYLSRSVEDLVQGELLQLEYAGKRFLTREEYFDIVRCKTASLFSWCTRAAAMIAELPEEEVDGMAKFGHHFGVAFQMADDVLDYAGASTDMGKANLHDLAEGKVTLPLILAGEEDPDIPAKLEAALLAGGGAIREEDRESIAQAVLSTGAVEGSLALAQTHADLALDRAATFPDSPWKDALTELCRFIISRIH